MRRNGFTLVETLIVVVMLGIMTMIGWPKLRGALATSDLRSSRGAVIAMFTQARTAAMQTSRRTELQIRNDSAYLLARPAAGGTYDTLRVESLSARYGVVISSDTIEFSPNGIMRSTGVDTLDILKSGHGITVVIEPPGSIR